MKSNKGFTLIELLAVIVVLAIIALIATPIVLNLIDQAKQGAAESSATAYVKATETAVMTAMVQDSEFALCKNTAYTLAAKDGDLTATDCDDISDPEVSGTKPTAGTITFDENGSISSATLTVDSRTIVYNPATGSHQS